MGRVAAVRVVVWGEENLHVVRRCIQRGLSWGLRGLLLLEAA